MFRVMKGMIYNYFSLSRGEGGIRTPGTLLGVRQFSKLLLSATQAPLHPIITLTHLGERAG